MQNKQYEDNIKELILKECQERRSDPKKKDIGLRKNTIKILIADECSLFREGLCSLLETVEGFEIIGETGDGYEAIELVEANKPDIVLMDITLTGLNCFNVCKKIKIIYPDIKIIIISEYKDASFIQEAFKAGAQGFLYKGSSFNELKQAIKNISKNDPYVSNDILKSIIDKYTEMPNYDALFYNYKKLTSRETEVLNLLAKGYSRIKIAEHLFISPRTVDRHKCNLKKKLGIKNDIQILEKVKMLEKYH